MKLGEEKLYAKLLILHMIGPDKTRRQISLPTLAERGNEMNWLRMLLRYWRRWNEVV